MGVKIDLEFLSSTLKIKFQNQIGSAFYVNFDDGPVIITAAHIVAGMQVGDQSGIRFEGDWSMDEVIAISRCEAGTDVCAYKLRRDWGYRLREDQLGGGLLQGEDVAYCGFPLDMEMEGYEGDGRPLGFVKGAILSGGITGQHGGRDLLFDTINNVGFSGGPIVKNDTGNLRVAAVVSGYRHDAPAPVFQKQPNGDVEKLDDFFIKPNSGFMIGVPIGRAINAARNL